MSPGKSAPAKQSKSTLGLVAHLWKGLPSPTRIAITWTAIVLGSIVILYVLCLAAKPWPRRVFVLNGTSNAYSVRLDGVDYQVPASRHIELKLNEGNHTIEPASPAAPFKSQQFQIRSTFLLRPFLGTVFVVNPDLSGQVTVTTIHYRKFVDPRTSNFNNDGGGRGPDKVRHTREFVAGYDVDDVLDPSPNVKADTSDRTRLDFN